MHRILILGATSWIGYRLGEALLKHGSGVAVAGTSRGSGDGAYPGVSCSRAATALDFASALERFAPTHVVNLLRGEDAVGAEIHEAVIRHCAGSRSLYCYASSALALDGYAGCALTEELPARSVTPYGQFKQACEAALIAQSDCRHLILRFASIQGWVPHRRTRNEKFLVKLRRGETVSVDQGVRQNRLLDTALATAVARLLVAEATGVVHLGTEDASDEVDFLRRVAKAFGFNPGGVRPGPVRGVNLVTVPGRLYDLCPDLARPTESDTIAGLLQYEGLVRCAASG
ncbi:MAG TPA: sugar nucleotide-binding protein [Verrucomicrobiota bacterium]|nr:sugar nucleotide-binding protein [Verrucomicrobiota bacterium]